MGSSETALGEGHAFFWHDGEMTDMGTLGGVFTVAREINKPGTGGRIQRNRFGRDARVSVTR